MEDELFVIMQALDANLKEFDNKLAVFNQFFSDYSRKLYDENFILSYDKDDELIKFHTTNIEGNQGSGKKQSLFRLLILHILIFDK